MACYVSIGLHILHRHIGLLFSFLFFPSLKPIYDTNLVWDPCVIWSARLQLVQYYLAVISLYDINLRATTTTILSTRGVMIPIYFVRSATDSIRRRIVLFKLVTIQTSDPKSEFLCQSSLCCAEPADPPEPPRTPGISPMPSPTHITHIVTVQVLSPSTSKLSYALSVLNVLVAAFQLKLSRTFHSNVTWLIIMWLCSTWG